MITKLLICWGMGLLLAGIQVEKLGHKLILDDFSSEIQVVECWSDMLAGSSKNSVCYAIMKESRRAIEAGVCKRKKLFYWLFGFIFYLIQVCTALSTGGVIWKEFQRSNYVSRKSSLVQSLVYARRYSSLKVKSFSSNTFIVYMVRLIANYHALELVYMTGSLSYCYSLTVGLSKETTDQDIEHLDFPKQPDVVLSCSSNCVSFNKVYMFLFRWTKECNVRGVLFCIILLKLVARVVFPLHKLVSGNELYAEPIA